MLNVTESSYWNEDGSTANQTEGLDGQDIFVIVSFSFIFLSGLVGNGLVICVILRHAKMKTVTYMYLLNLATSDSIFLMSIPTTSVTTWLKHWIFGEALCKIHFTAYSITIFTTVFTLMALSIERYFAVCHPFTSLKYRQPMRAVVVIVIIWIVSVFIVLPVILYAKTTAQNPFQDRRSCTIVWPNNQPIRSDKAFTLYVFLLGFAIPVPLITVLYMMIVVKLRTMGPSNQQTPSERQKKGTRMVLAVIAVYIICWMPYWVFQINLTYNRARQLSQRTIFVFKIITSLSYANSMLNPILYAFMSENFRKGFKQTFVCKKNTLGRITQKDNAL